MRSCARALAFVVLAVLTMSACGEKSPTGVTGTPALSITGGWTYRLDAIDQAMMATCQTRGTISFAQFDGGDQFGGGVVGIQSCSDGGVSTGNVDVIVPISAGELAGAVAKFVALGCMHTGTATGSPPNRFTGTVTCSLAVTEGGMPRSFTGTWEATR